MLFISTCEARCPTFLSIQHYYELEEALLTLVPVLNYHMLWAMPYVPSHTMLHMLGLQLHDCGTLIGKATGVQLTRSYMGAAKEILDYQRHGKKTD